MSGEMDNGELIPNRIFVGGLPLAAKDSELEGFFSKISGCVKEVKIIMDGKGSSKGFGFITFETEAEVTKLLNNKQDTLLFKDAKLNLAKAYRRKTYYNNNSHSYNYNHKSGNSNYKQANPTSLQIDHSSTERYLISPTSGKALNAMTPTPPPVEPLADTEESEGPDVENQNKPIEIINSDNTDSKILNESPRDSVDELVLNDFTNEEKELDIENLNELQREDKNNNIITKLTKMPEDDIIKMDRDEDEEIKKNPASPSLVERKKEPSKHTNYHNQSNQRNYHMNNNYRGNSNHNFQSQHNNRFHNLQAQAPNNNHSKFSHQMQKGATHSQHQQFHYYYAMAAAIASGNIPSPGNQQLTNQGHNSKLNYAHQKNKQHGDSLQGGKKSSHNYVGSVMNGNQNFINHAPHLIEPNFQNGLKNNASSNNYQNLNAQSSHGVVKASSANTNQYAYNYQNQQPPNNLNTIQPLNSSGNGSNHVQSTPSYSSSSSSSVSSGTPSHQTNSVQPMSAQVQAQCPHNLNMGTNNTAVNYVNYAVPVNASVPGGLVVNQNGYPDQYNPENAVLSPYAVPVNQQYTVYPNYYYNHSVNHGKPQQSINTSPNSQATSTDYTNTVSSATPGSLTPQSQFNSNQPQSIYYPSSSSSGAPLQQQTAKTTTEVNNNYVQQGSTVSTITNAFETATKSSNDQTIQSTQNLEDLFTKNLTLQTDNNPSSYPQPQFYYLAQPGYPPMNNGSVNSTIPVNTPPQYFYYYAPAPASGAPINPNYQISPALVQPVQMNNQILPINQQLNEQSHNPNLTQNPPNPYPMQVLPSQATAPLSGPHPSQLPQIYPGQQQQSQQTPYNLPQVLPQQMQAPCAVPLLQLPNLNYQTQQIPVHQNSSLAPSPQNQNQNFYKQNVQSPGKQNSLSGPSQQQNKGQHYQNPMYQIEGSLDQNFSPSYQKNSHSNKYDQTYRQNPSSGHYRNNNQNKGNYNGRYNMNNNHKSHYKSNQYQANYNSCSNDMIAKNSNGFNSKAAQNDHINVSNFPKNEQQVATETTV